MAKPYVIGLTGNIATGKSTVARMLRDLGACIIDADQVAHDVMRAGTAVHAALVARFGEGILAANGEIDRRALAAIVFADPEALLALDAIVHPAVRVEVRHLVSECPDPVVVIEAIKLLEAGMDADCDSIWVVTAPRDVQIVRVMERSALTREEAEQRIDAQGPQCDKVQRADTVIDNSRSLACTRRQVERAWGRTFGPVPGLPEEEPS